MRRVVLTLGLMLGATSVAAQEESRVEARQYFDAGQKAFVKTKYGAAIAAFEQAQRASPHPAIVFSLAQAYRLRYFVDRDDADLLRAAELYRQYLTQAPAGRRREHAVEHLSGIGPLVARLRLTQTTTVAKVVRAPTRIMVQVDVESARVTLDARESVPAPLIEEVAPGRHQVRVEADGYFPVVLTRTAAEGAIAVIDVELKPRPGALTVHAPDGAMVYVDGEQHAEAPLEGPLTLAEGNHRLEVIESGKDAFVREVKIEKGGAVTINAKLERTGERVAALWLFAGAGALTVAGSLAAGVGIKFAADADTTAQKLLIQKQSLTEDEINSYKGNKRRRGQSRVLAGTMYSMALAGVIVGSLLYAFDKPQPGIAPAIVFEPGSGGAQVGLQVELD